MKLHWTDFILEILKIVVPFLSGGLFTKLLENYLKLDKNKDLSKTSPLGIQNKTFLEWENKKNEEICAIFSNLIEKTEVEQCILFQGNNGEAYPNPNKPYFVKVLITDEKHNHLKNLYGQFAVDRDFCTMALTSVTNNQIYIDTKNLREDSVLGRIYRYEKILHSVIFFLDTANNKMLFGSFSTYQDKEFFSSLDNQLPMLFAIDKLRNSWNKFNKNERE